MHRRLRNAISAALLTSLGAVIAPSHAQPHAERIEAWDRLTTDLPADALKHISSDITLGQVLQTAQDLISGHVRGRVVVDVNQE